MYGRMDKLRRWGGYDIDGIHFDVAFHHPNTNANIYGMLFATNQIRELDWDDFHKEISLFHSDEHIPVGTFLPSANGLDYIFRTEEDYKTRATHIDYAGVKEEEPFETSLWANDDIWYSPQKPFALIDSIEY